MTIARLLAMPGASVLRYDGARTATVVAGWSEDGLLSLPLASTVDVDGDTVVAKVLRSGSPQRVERYQDSSGPLAETLQRSGYRAAVAAPVTVDGRRGGGWPQRLGPTSRCRKVSSSDAAHQTLLAAQDLLSEGLEELRELARGIHPVRTERGSCIRRRP